MEQLSILDFTSNKFKITKPIRLIELFGGYGSQNLALKYLGLGNTHYKLCEWAIKSIQAYNDLHIQDYTDYSKVLTDEEVLNKLVEYGVSADYNEPCSYAKLKRMKYRTIYNNIIATNNLVDISKVKASDLEITDTNKYCYVMTYSFPCQDLSLAGQCKGMAQGSNTRSSLLWQVERILKECKQNELPQVLLMENVIQVHSKKNLEDFNKWIQTLEELGYSNYWQDLNAKQYGIPQNRNRTFMVSILGDYKYEFPKPINLELKLKDMLEDNVDEKYILSDKMLKAFTAEGSEKYPRAERFYQNIFRKNQDVENAITTRAGGRPTDNFILSPKMKEYIVADNEKWTGNNDKAIVNKSIASTINTGEGSRRCDASNYIAYGLEEDFDLKQLKIKNATKQGYLEAEEGDGINISSRMQYQRGNVQKQSCQTIKCDGGNSVGVVTKVIGGIGDKAGNNQWHLQDRVYQGENANAITTSFNPWYALENLTIRKLTPLECFRLQGLRDEDAYKIINNQSQSSCYHLAGDSICVNVLMAIFSKML